ncbi:MAG: BLUF domain-containing protein [Sphingobacteriaceae bacterium]|nr:MAG: BLUF domain-containing protein [Sphingobacteriaceae bacterium]
MSPHIGYLCGFTRAALYQFAYCSISTIYDPSQEILDDIVRSARYNNLRNEITGILLYKDSGFLQIIEGEEQALKDTVFLILKDRRHKHIIILYNVPIEKRDFSEWRLAFRTPAFTPKIGERLKGTDFNEYITDPAGISTKLSKRAQTLLTVFEEHM